jgi:hypothetical protein
MRPECGGRRRHKPSRKARRRTASRRERRDDQIRNELIEAHRRAKERAEEAHRRERELGELPAEDRELLQDLDAGDQAITAEQVLDVPRRDFLGWASECHFINWRTVRIEDDPERGVREEPVRAWLGDRAGEPSEEEWWLKAHREHRAQMLEECREASRRQLRERSQALRRVSPGPRIARAPSRASPAQHLPACSARHAGRARIRRRTARQ